MVLRSFFVKFRDNKIWIRSLTPKILRPTWGNKAENIKAEKGGAEKKDRKKNEKKKKKIFLKFNLNTNWLSALFPEFFFLQSELSALIFGA